MNSFIASPSSPLRQNFPKDRKSKIFSARENSSHIHFIETNQERFLSGENDNDDDDDDDDDMTLSGVGFG